MPPAIDNPRASHVDSSEVTLEVKVNELAGGVIMQSVLGPANSLASVYFAQTPSDSNVPVTTTGAKVPPGFPLLSVTLNKTRVPFEE
jgi:hypothetical protein